LSAVRVRAGEPKNAVRSYFRAGLFLFVDDCSFIDLIKNCFSFVKHASVN